jgi:hypothetical protein
MGGISMGNWKSWVGAALVLGALAANAADPQPAGQSVDTAKAMLDRMDRNVDGKFPKEWLAGADVQGATGKVTFEQFADELRLVFEHFDVDKDEQLDATEIAAFAAARKTQEESRS